MQTDFPILECAQLCGHAKMDAIAHRAGAASQLASQPLRYHCSILPFHIAIAVAVLTDASAAATLHVHVCIEIDHNLQPAPTIFNRFNFKLKINKNS